MRGLLGVRRRVRGLGSVHAGHDLGDDDHRAALLGIPPGPTAERRQGKADQHEAGDDECAG